MRLKWFGCCASSSAAKISCTTARMPGNVSDSSAPRRWRSRHPSPRVGRQCQRQGAQRDRPGVLDKHQLRSRPTPAPTRREVDGWRAGKHREMKRDPDRIRQTPAMEGSPEGGDVAKLGVREHGGDLQPRGAGAPDQRQRLPPFFLERGVGGNLRHRSAVAIAEPLLREIQESPDQPRPRSRPQRGRRRGNCRSCPAAHSTGAPHRPNGSPVWESSCRR
jgi:hypothetical protein